MSPGLWTVAAVACVLVLSVAVLVVLTVRARRRDRRALDRSHAELEALRARVDELSARLTTSPDDAVDPPRPSEEFVITSVPERGAAVAVPEDEPVPQLTAGQFASVAVGESLVRLVSLGYGVRRALSAETRNRIRFEMRREVKRARKQRRRDLKEAKRNLRADQGREAA
jgi:hypothetical protein